MNKKQLKKEISLHYDDGISMNDPETAIENILITIEENFLNNNDILVFANWYAYELKKYVYDSRETEPTLKEWKEQIKDL